MLDTFNPLSHLTLAIVLLLFHSTDEKTDVGKGEVISLSLQSSRATETGSSLGSPKQDYTEHIAV